MNSDDSLPTLCLSALGMKTNKRSLILSGDWCNTPASLDLVKEQGLEVRLAEARVVTEEQYLKEASMCEELFDYFMDELSTILNSKHQAEFSKRYWSTLLHPFLYQLIATIVDHLEVIKYLSLKFGKIDAEVLSINNEWVDPHFLSGGSSRLFHFLVFSRIVQNTGYLNPVLANDDNIIECIERVGDGKKSLKKTENKVIKNHFRSVVRSLKDYLSGKVELKKFKDKRMEFAFLGNQYLDKKDLTSLFNKLGERNFFIYGEPISREGLSNKNKRSRESLLVGECHTEVHKLVALLIREMMPTLFWENYDLLRSHFEEITPNYPLTILNSLNYSGGPSLDFFIATSVERNSSSHVMACHGGCYGAMEISVQEKVWSRVVDYYALWSNPRGFDGIAKVIKMPSLRFNKWNIWEKSYQKNGQILVFVTGHYPSRYAYNSIYPYTIDSEYQAWQVRFLEGLSMVSLGKVLIRDYHQSQRLSENEFVKWLCDNNVPVDSSIPFSSSVEMASLCIHTLPQTTYLETIVMNRPTICFWNPDANLIRKDLRVFYEKMYDVGVFHRSPESAAEKVNDVIGDPLEWWESREVAEATYQFRKNVAYTSGSALDEWAIFLKGLSRRNENP
ncbi:MAG: LIC12162 family protein [Bacteriovoracaceae bacterium]|nr:LIC12162 family protein [Bacteriovoracaceae bacterium]